MDQPYERREVRDLATGRSVGLAVVDAGVLGERREQLGDEDLVGVGLHEDPAAPLDEQPLVRLLRLRRVPLAEVDAAAVDLDEGEVSTVRALEASVGRLRVRGVACCARRALCVRRHGRGSTESYTFVYVSNLAYGRAVLGRVVATRDVSVGCDKRAKGLEPSTFSLEG